MGKASRNQNAKQVVKKATAAAALTAGITHKPCSQCGVSKLLTDYHVQKEGKHGRHAKCKDCRSSAHKRCSVAGCNSIAQTSKSGTGNSANCIAHGGGDRCRHQDVNGVSDCKNSAEHSKSGTGIAGHCVVHGGGDRCQHQDVNGMSDCKNSAVSSSTGTGIAGNCKAHGGGHRCDHKDVNGVTDCIVAARDSITNCCIAHGGGPRCEQECCTAVGQPLCAKGKHPDTGQGMCTHSMRFMCQNASDKAERDSLMKHFKFKKDLVMRGEHSFYHALALRVPEIQSTIRVLDESVIKKLFGKVKSLDDPRPDYYHYISTKKGYFAILGEYDETDKHEDSRSRLKTISDSTEAKWENTYVFRVMANHYTEQAVCEKIINIKAGTSYFLLTDFGKSVVEETAKAVKQMFSWIEQGLSPTEADGPRPQVHYINFS